MTFFTKKFKTFSKVTGPYKYYFQMLKGLKLRLNMPGVFLTPVCHRRVKKLLHHIAFSDTESFYTIFLKGSAKDLENNFNNFECKE